MKAVHVAADTGAGALLRAATAAGHGPRLRELLDGGNEPARDDAELMLWAADYGAFEVINGRLDEHTTKPMLRIARRWIGADPVAELRRRLGDPGGVVRRGTVPVGDYAHVECVRVTAGDGRWAETRTAHPAIVTYIEQRLGIAGSCDELMARALTAGDPDSINWSQAREAVADKPDTEATLAWAATVLTGPGRDARLFAAEVAHALSFVPASCSGDVLALIRARLTAEPDATVLDSLIGAYAEYHGRGCPPEIVAHAAHPDPQVRRRVAGELCYALMDPASVEAGAGVLATLGADPDPSVRATALRVLRDHAYEQPATGRLIAARREDPDPGVRAEALAGAARGGDIAAVEELRRLGETDHRIAALATDAARWLRAR